MAGVAPVVVPETRGYRESADTVATDDASQQRAANDVATGIVIMVASIVVLPLMTYALAASAGGGWLVVGVGPFLYGLFRLARGLDAKKVQATSPRSPRPRS
jgi:hypothetical protein